MAANEHASGELHPREVFSEEELAALVQRIIHSGELGRSKIYASLLTYLIEYSNKHTSPKEVEIAIDVLGRDTNFDATKDSVVRVYVHQLRKKLDRYYAKHEADAPYRIVIPKGQYTIAAAAAENESAGAKTEAPENWRWRSGLTLAAALLLAANLVYLGARDLWPAPASPAQAAAERGVWAELLDDDIPLLVVMGDYYIFGELDEAGNVKRMVREFDINSKADLDNAFAQNPEMGWQYRDLDLSYLPEGSAAALNSIMPVLQHSNKRINIKMMSELSIRDLKNYHVIYIGYISGLGRLESIVFAASDLRPGENYDQLINKRTGDVYISNAGLPSSGHMFLDYGLFTHFPTSGDNQVVVIAGTRDAGLMNTAQASIQPAALDDIEQTLGHVPPAKAFEVLYEVHGLDRMNFDANIVFANTLNPDSIWRADLGSL